MSDQPASETTPEEPLYVPRLENMKASRLAAFKVFVEQRYNVDFGDELGPECYKRIHAWSVAADSLEDFLEASREFTGMVGDFGDVVMRKIDKPPYVEFYPDSKINYAENVLRHWIENPDQVAIEYRHQDGPVVAMTGKELVDEVSRWEQVLRAQGIEKGDCVAMNMPYTPEATIITLAAANIGAPVVKAGTELKLDDLVARFKQAEPKILIAPDGYKFGDKVFDFREAHGYDDEKQEHFPKLSVKHLQDALPSVEKTLILPYANGEVANLAGLENVEDAYALKKEVTAQPLVFERHDFDHPLYYLFTSGTTGTPKGLIHSHGRITHRHFMEHQLNLNLGPGKKYAQESTVSWMMFDYHLTALGSGASLMIHDGKFGHPNFEDFLDFALENGVTHYCAVAGRINKGYIPNNVNVADKARNSKLEMVIYTGGPVSVKGYEYLAENICPGVPIVSASGGTDGCFVLVGGNPFALVYKGKTVGPMMGTAIECWDEDGQAAPVGEKGELVFTQPVMSMPVGLLGDENGARYHKAYFSEFEAREGSPWGAVWTQEDRVAIFADGQIMIYGRSKMTHNKNGKKVDPYNIYEVMDSGALGGAGDLVRGRASVNYYHPTKPEDNLIVMFLTLRDGQTEVPEKLQNSIKAELLKKIGSHAVPDHIFAVQALPRTPNGKDIEVQLARVLAGEKIVDGRRYVGVDHIGAEISGLEAFENIYRKLNRSDLDATLKVEL